MAQGLIFFAPGEDREHGLPKWEWELWRFLLPFEFKLDIPAKPNASLPVEEVRVMQSDYQVDPCNDQIVIFSRNGIVTRK